MTTSERATQIWAVLALAAMNRQVLTYEIVGRLIGVPKQGLGQLLEPIQSYCLLNKYPPLTALVVSKQTGLPSPGFIATENVPLEQVRVFEFKWLDIQAPTSEVFQQATILMPSNGIQPTPGIAPPSA